MRSLILLVCWLGFISIATGQTRDEIVRSDKEKVQREGFWIYNDIPTAMQQAKESGKPILVVLRCLPCHECVKLDDELVDTHPVIRPLLEKFVCVRQVSTNGLDLDLFQYDTDQSFAVFFLNADQTIYGRFGTRSHRTEWTGDVSLKGLEKALKAVLDMHQNYDAVKASLAGKTGQPLEFKSPEQFPSLRNAFTDQLNYEGNVVKSCIHCHQIGDARRDYYWSSKKPIPNEILWPYPHPKSIGLILDPHSKATVRSVAPSSIAATAGLKADDQIQSLNGQPLISMADVQWVLNTVPDTGANVNVRFQRDGREMRTELKLPAGWRQLDDTSWRVGTWWLRRVALGGLVLENASEAQRAQANIPAGKMALRIKRAGQYGPHGTARRKGFREGDLIVAYDGRDDFAREADLLAYAAEKKSIGQQVKMTIRRGRDQLEIALPIQK